MIAGGALLSVFTIEAREYRNFAFDASARATARNIILGLCIGIILAALYAAYQRGVVGKPVRALLRAEALSPDSAKSLSELGLAGNPFVCFELAHNRVLKSLIRELPAAGDEEEPRYYIPEELKYRADVRFDAKGNGVAALILTAAVAAGLALALIALLPGFLSIIDNLL